MKRVVVVLLATLLPALASAQTQNSLGMGGTVCRNYLRAARSSDILYHQASQWLLGYASGISSALKPAGSAEQPAAISADQVLKSAAAYCEANPTGTIAAAANEWYAALPKQEPQQTQAQPQPKSGGSLMLNLDVTPDRKPLLERH